MLVAPAHITRGLAARTGALCIPAVAVVGIEMVLNESGGELQRRTPGRGLQGFQIQFFQRLAIE
jgi:hypothetical protein